ncbi:MAG: Nucleoside-diphosphate-sugar epimerases [uncultured Rubrobacteraceae bacterium]|uniref:Nucleoside-diphosphate-sugar epimerases n=1 Tax=uncultured Rubrobacteraceae bacterium TaxID=349277 RepID=A0A6J4QKT9_9ACTN|nr:MAG: Nucleoside-diphosphate-sugar epimerases [uncultured Rubrobacteraceae bacterium]
MRILISGCGYVGTSLGLLLASEGHTVFGLRRNTSALPPGIYSVEADLSTPLPVGTLPGDLDAVVHMTSPGGSTDEFYKTAYVDGPRNILSALAPHNVLRRFILVSSTGVYGQKDGGWVDEGSPAEPESASGRRLLEGESLVLGGPVSAVVLRLGGIYGPGRTGAIERALREQPREVDPARYTNRIHRDDCAGALRHLLLLRDPDPLYLGVDHEPAPRRAVAEWLASRPDLSRQSIEVPQLTAQADNNTRARTNKRCSNARLVASGYRFRYPTFREGFATLLDKTYAP